MAAGRCAIVFWPAAAFWAFFTLRLAAWVCFLVAMASSFVVNCLPATLYPAMRPANRQLSVYRIR